MASEAERALREAHDTACENQCKNWAERKPGRAWHQECLWVGHVALDACIWAVLRERGHVMRCCCASVASLDDYNMSDPRCAPPAWLLEVKK